MKTEREQMIKTHQPAGVQHRDGSKAVRLSHGVMEGNGAYNRHALSQAAGAAIAIPFFERAIEKMTLETAGGPINIADYGSSQGKNSLLPIGSAIRKLRQCIGADRPICVFHVDQPSNDFNSLFEVLTSDQGRYEVNHTNVFPCAVGRSFYEQVLPAESVHLGWSSNAAMWLSRIPSFIHNHFWSVRGTGTERAAFERQAAEDWENFLSLRGREMRPGAQLVVVLPTPLDDVSSGITNLMDSANAVLEDMVNEGAITAEERAAMVLGAHPRKKREVLAPFAKDGHFQRLSIENYDELILPDAAWTEYETAGNEKTLASKRARFFRATFMPSLASALGRVRDGDREAITAFADRLESGLTRRTANHPAPMDILTQTLTLTKSG
jgi:hypothetical protein